MSNESITKDNGPSPAVIGGALSAITGLLAGAAGAGWPGVIALGALGLAIPLGWGFLVRLFNSWSDGKALERAGADAGKTAVEVANQGREVSQGLDAAQKADPPTDGFPK